MKRIIAVAVMMALLAVSAFCVTYGTSTVTKQTITKQGTKEWIILTVVWAANTSAQFSDITISATTYGIEGYQLVAVETYPGATAPTGSYTTIIKNALGTTLVTNTGSATLGVMQAGSYAIPVTGDLTLSIGSQSVNSATATVKLYFAARVVAIS